MSTIEIECDRCIVSILINGTVKGTGFVIAPGKVLTCAHVVNRQEQKLDDEFLKNNIEIEFYAVTHEKPHVQPTRQAVKLDEGHYGPISACDIAVLTWEGELPEGVRPARFSFDTNLSDRPIRSRGFSGVRDYGSQAGTGEIVGPIANSTTGVQHWTLRRSQRGSVVPPYLINPRGM